MSTGSVQYEAIILKYPENQGLFSFFIIKVNMTGIHNLIRLQLTNSANNKDLTPGLGGQIIPANFGRVNGFCRRARERIILTSEITGIRLF
jgi:hypothetical protein